MKASANGNQSSQCQQWQTAHPLCVCCPCVFLVCVCAARVCSWHVCVCSSACTCGGQRLTWHIVLSCFLLHVWDRVFHWAWVDSSSLGWPASPPHCTRVTDVCHHTWFWTQVLMPAQPIHYPWAISLPFINMLFGVVFEGRKLNYIFSRPCIMNTSYRLL